MLDASSRAADFPSIAGITYLNTAAESVPPRCTVEALAAYGQDKLRGMRGRDAHFATAETCREIAARHLGLQPAEVAFCSCTSEAYNLLASALQLRANDEVVVSDLDFPAGVTPWMRAVDGPTMRRWNAAHGKLDVADLKPLLNEHTRLVQVSLVSFYNGHRIAWKALHQAVRSLAPNAVLAVDVTQALGRVVLDCSGADVLFCSSHKWTLGMHGSCIVGVPTASAERLTTHAGGWLHVANAFDADRFDRAVPKPGAASFAVGMPNFAALYALNASLRYLDSVSIAKIAAHADPLMQALQQGLLAAGIAPLCDWDGSGIIAFTHSNSTAIHAALERENIHVMHSAGRIRIAVHGYNTAADIERLLSVLAPLVNA